MRLPALALVLAVSACAPHDPRLPKQLPQPATPNAPAVAVAPSTAVGVAPTAPPTSADAGVVPSAPVGDPPKGTPETPTTDAPPADNGFEENRRLLEEPAWADGATLKNACERSLARAKALRDRLQRGTVPVEETLAVFDQMSLELDTIEGLSSLMFNVSPEKAVRDVAEACRNDLSKFASEVSLDKKLYEVLDKVPHDDASGLDAVSKHFIDVSLREFRLAGVD